MADDKICPHCGKPVPPSALGDLCPECMLKAGLATQTEGPGTAGEAAGPRFIPPPVGEIAKLFPQLEIIRLIGQGGMGAVYKARQPSLDRFVALKVLPPATAGDPGFAERFNREARALARLNHPNIVAVHDFGKAGTLHYLVMEFVDGANLREVERLGELTPEQALAIVPQICEALQFAHNEGIVHRDIKPENLLLDKRGRVKITDFGIAKMVGVGTGQQNLTGAKDVVGTPHYMAPEQIEKPLSVDHRADIYSLGVVFYEMLTGELPLGKFQPPSKKVEIDVRLDEVVLHALEKEPNRRYQQASQVKSAVETIVTTPGGTDPANQNEPAPTAAQIEAARQRLKIPARGLIAAGVLLVFFALGLLAFGIPAITSEGRDAMGYAAVGFGAAVLMLLATVVFLGANSMIKLRNHSFSIVASVVAAFAGPGALLGLPFGIWACLELIRPEVRAAFAANSQNKADPAFHRGMRSASSPPLQRPDRFWRHFVVAVAAVLFTIILVPALVVLLAMFLPALHAHRNRIARETVVQQNVETSFFIGQASFPQGDSIEITSVERTPEKMLVKGRYNLVSHDQATLALYITVTNDNAPEGSGDVRPILRGTGDFALVYSPLVPGLPHVSMYADGHPFASLYFGTSEEAQAESTAGWITNGTHAPKFSERFAAVIRRESNAPASSLQFRLVLPDNSTAPADWLPSASDRSRLRVSRQILLDDTAIARAGVDFDPSGRRMIQVRFTDAGAKQFEAITATNIGRQLAIVFRGRVLSAPVIQSVIPGGECQITGLTNASEVHEIVDYLNRTSVPTAEAWKFSLPSERVLPFKPFPSAWDGWLDLDSGMILTNSSVDWTARAGYEWIRTNGLDVVASESSKHFPLLIGFDISITPAPTNGWDLMTPADVANSWTLWQAEPRQKQVFGAMPGQSDTFIFQTREGGNGILQILGIADNPPGVKIRYKLVQTKSSGEATDSATGLPAGQPNVRIDPNTGLPLAPGVTNATIDSATGLPVAQPATNDTTNPSADMNSSTNPASTAMNIEINAVEPWLALVDKGRYAESWETAADSFHDAITKSDWVGKLEEVRRPLGNLVSRTLRSTEQRKTLEGVPDGSYFVAKFDTAFASFKPATETVIFSLEKDGQWQAVRYTILPGDSEDAAVISNAAKPAVSAAEKWLQSIDDGHYAESWNTASIYFHDAITQDKWVSALGAARQPLGDLVSRQAISAQRMAEMPGAPDGQYVVMQFQTSFTNKKSAVETVAFILEKGGHWKAAGYYIK